MLLVSNCAQRARASGCAIALEVGSRPVESVGMREPLRTTPATPAPKSIDRHIEACTVTS